MRFACKQALQFCGDTIEGAGLWQSARREPLEHDLSRAG
jgi:hypothetical protein